MEKPPVFTDEDLDRTLGLGGIWDRGYLGSGITIGLIDTGVKEIPELGDVVIKTQNCVQDEDPASLQSDHGTAMALCIHCIAPRSKLVSFKVFPTHDKALWFRKNDQVRRAVTDALDFCIEHYPRIRVVNLSLAIPRTLIHPCSPQNPCSVCQSIQRAHDAGIVVVAAAGNSGPKPDTIECPGRAQGAITVGASLNAENTAYYRRHGDPDGRYGTSYSCAYITGGVALLLSACPEATPEEIRLALKCTARPLPGEPPNAQGAGQARLDRALVALIGPSQETYQKAHRQLYALSGNPDAQNTANDYFTQPLELALSYIEKSLINRGLMEDGAKALQEIMSYLVPGRSPSYESKISELLHRTDQP
jgi:hypothetical protein